MDFRHLEHFVAVAEERSFTRAAQRLHIVQSAVSASIRTLERDLQTELFNRTTQRVELADAGATLLPQARRILAEVASARELVADVRGGLRGTLAIGTMKALSAGPVDLARLLAEFRGSHRYSRSSCDTPLEARPSWPSSFAMVASTSRFCRCRSAGRRGSC
jgi:DNA-binding transcriptional LysR family regulator